MKTLYVALCSLVLLAFGSMSSAQNEIGTTLAPERAWPESLRRATAPLMNMEMKQNCTPFSRDGLPLLDCTYRTGSASQRKTARVFLVDVPQQKWMDWIGNACERIQQLNNNCFSRVVRQIREQSGGQIPWAGIVYEDIKPRDGLIEAYCFRNGISIAVTGLQRWLTRPLTAQEVHLCFQSPEVIFVGVFPRPISLHVNDYMRATGKSGFLQEPGVGNTRWLAEIRSVLIQSMNSRENFFITEWTRLNVR